MGLVSIKLYFEINYFILSNVNTFLYKNNHETFINYPNAPSLADENTIFSVFGVYERHYVWKVIFII